MTRSPSVSRLGLASIAILLLAPAACQLVQDGWTAFGDSYAAGIGAGQDFGGPASCRRRTNAFPNLLNLSPRLGTPAGSRIFNFVACSGALIENVQTNAEGTSQIDLFRNGGPNVADFATISIGGNDVDFGGLLEACIFRANPFNIPPPCQTVIFESYERIRNLGSRLEATYEAILQTARAAGKPASFKLVVTGYPQFFNGDTAPCNDYHMNFWRSAAFHKQYLTLDLRFQLNNLVRLVNEAIEQAINNVNRRATWGDVIFVPISDIFQGHRFCEPGVVEPDNQRPGTWFFLLDGADAQPDGEIADPPSGTPIDVSPAECDALLAGSTPSFGDEWGVYVICAIRRGLASGLELEDWVNATLGGGDFSGSLSIPEKWAKAFHPKTIGHHRIRDEIELHIDTVITVRRVLIMFRGDVAAFDAMIARLPPNGHNDAERIEFGNLDIRGYTTWLTVRQAHAARDLPGVEGLCYEDASIFPPGSVAPPTEPGNEDDGPSFLDAGGILRRESMATSDKQSNNSGVLFGKRQTTSTPLDLQFLSKEHLNILSRPPKSRGVDYRDYGSYLHEPRGGENVNVYVLDTGCAVNHLEFTTQNRIPRSFFGRHVANGIVDESRVAHGSCMASMVGGWKYGVTKRGANIIPVKWQTGPSSNRQQSRASDYFESLLWILNDVLIHGKKGKAVINFSGAIPIGQWAFSFDLRLNPDSTNPLYLKSDPWQLFLPEFERNDIVVVCSVGNTFDANSFHEADSQFPRRHAHRGRVGEHTLIVVGGTSPTGTIWREVTPGGNVIGTNRFFDIITTWAPAERLDCVHADPAKDPQVQSGTSLATALVSGMIATFLDRMDLAERLQVPGEVARRVKAFVVEAGRYHTDQQPDHYDILGTYNYVPCDEPGAPPPQHPEDPTNPTVDTIPIRQPGQLTEISYGTCPNEQPPLQPDPMVGDYSFVSCVREIPAPDLVLREATSVQGTLEACAQECVSTGYPFFGMAHGSDCYCGLRVHNAQQVDQSQCSSRCRDEPTTPCGGPSAISLYSTVSDPAAGIADVEGWTYAACYVDSEARTISGANFPATDMTPARCASICGAGGWRIFGVEYGTECWCGNGELDSALIANVATCNVRCGGDSTVLCGGGWRLTVYTRPLGDIPRIQQVPGWTYTNCYTDDWVRTLPEAQPTSTAMTPEACAARCAGRRFFGVEAGIECFCGDELTPGRLAGDPNTCDAPCAGQPNFVCGGGWRITVYRRNAPPVEAVTGWQHATCTIDSLDRTLQGAQFDEPGMTAGRCAQLCCGWRYFGVQHGTECFCGNDLVPGLEAPLYECDMPCGGNTGFACGAGWRLNLYEDLPGDAPGCASSCSEVATRSCQQDRCDGSFDLDTGVATCKGAFRGCRCVPNGETCGPPLSCDMNNCAGTFDADGFPTCKGFFAGCRCAPTANTCGPRRSCDAADCAGVFDLSDGKSYCTRGTAGCECTATTATCGPMLSCDLNNCAGAFSMADGLAYCNNFFAGCRCLPTPNTCGPPQSCDMNSCAGSFDADGFATCKGFFAGCRCAPTPNTCGPPQSCDLNNCYGSFDMSNGRAYCRGAFATCECAATLNTCGTPQSCDMNNCAGSFDLASGLAFCRGFFSGCRCLATDNTCGPQLSCDLNDCAGGYDGSGVARCRGKFAGCRCLATANTCGGEAQSCDLNGCNGGWDANGVARCRGNFAGCVCRPTDNTCGTPQSCSAGGCNGEADGVGQGRCRDRYAGCRCNANTGTPGYCGQLTQCSFSGCQGVDIGQQLGRCRHSSHYDCPCYLPRPPPPPLQPSPPDPCISDCRALVNQLLRLPTWVCSNTPGFGYGSGSSGYNGGLDWWRIGAQGRCELAFAKMARSHGFPDAFCLSRSTIQDFVNRYAQFCDSNYWYIHNSLGIPSNWVGEGYVCMSTPGTAHYCGHGLPW